MPPAVGKTRNRRDTDACLTHTRFTLDGGAPFGIDGPAHGVDAVMLCDGQTRKGSSGKLFVTTNTRDNAHFPVLRVELVERLAFLDHARSHGREPGLQVA